MRESTTYQAILKEGREEGRKEAREEARKEGREEGKEMGKEMGRIDEARTLLIRIGTKRFGPPSATVQQTLSAIDDIARLEQLVERALDVETWTELLEESNL
jgi:predicted transposase YdaD